MVPIYLSTTLCALVPPGVPILHRPVAARFGAARPCMASDKVKNDIVPIDVQVLQNQLDAVRQLPRIKDKLGRAVQGMVAGTYEDPLEPTFRRLFTHATWERYTGEEPLRRWLRIIFGWRESSVLRSTWRPVACISLWALWISLAFPKGVITGLGLAHAFPRDVLIAGTSIVLSIQGAAIGLMLVFRTNNAYARLEEARLSTLPTWARTPAVHPPRR